MKKQYLFIFLIFCMLYLLVLIGGYKYNEYKVLQYMEQTHIVNETYKEQIEQAKKTIEKITTKAYKNKMLKFEQVLKNPGEIAITLISEKNYNTYTQLDTKTSEVVINTNSDPLNEQSLINTMTIYQKWIYLLFDKDIR